MTNQTEKKTLHETLNLLFSPYLAISSKNSACSAWSELAAFRAKTSKLQRSTSWHESARSDGVIDANSCQDSFASAWDLWVAGAYPEAVYDRCRLVWHGRCVGPLEHPGIMQCLCWVQIKFTCWHCAASVSQEMFIQILQCLFFPWKDVLKRKGG